MNKLLLRLPPPWPLLGAVQIWVDDALEPRLSHGEHEFISAREALSFTLSTVPWGSAFRVLVGSMKVIDRPAVLVEERWSAIPIWLHLGDVRLYTGHVVLLDQSLVDAKVVQSHEGPNQGRTPIKPLAQLAPEHSPSADQDAKGTLDRHPIRALVKVEVVEGWVVVGRRDHAWRDGECRIPVEEEGVG